jgi:hypothetical protein
MSLDDTLLADHRPGQRRDERTPCWRLTEWWAEGVDEKRRGVLVSASGAGLALLIDRDQAPLVGGRIRVAGRGRSMRTARVVRVDWLTGTTSRVAAVFDEELGAES